MIRLARIVFLAALVSAIVPIAASAAPRMPVGFQDDPTFRWSDDGQGALDRVQEANASIIRATVDWRAAAS